MSTEEKPQVPEAAGTTGAAAVTKDDNIEPSNPVAVDEDDDAVKDTAKGSDEVLRGPNGEEYPTKEELDTLRRIRGPINWLIYTVAFCELCERFAYYGTTVVCRQ